METSRAPDHEQARATWNDASPHVFNNGIAESALLLIRKTTEFFKPKGDRDPPATLYAYRYLDNWPGMWVIPKDIYIELHKRVGHITVVGRVRVVIPAQVFLSKHLSPAP